MNWKPSQQQQSFLDVQTSPSDLFYGGISFGPTPSDDECGGPTIHSLHPDVCKCSECAGFGTASRATTGRATTISRVDFEHRLATGEAVDFASETHIHPQQPTPRECRYCQTVQRTGVDCAHCGAPDDGKRGPLEMAPMGVVIA